MKYIGIDIGSTCSKVVVMEKKNEKTSIVYKAVQPTGWSSIDTSEMMKQTLISEGYDFSDAKVVATGYGRVSVPYADKTVTEITCHAMGAGWLFSKESATVIDIGGQDTKVILLDNGMVRDFAMNDKCSAGTGRFLEVMANTIGIRPGELCELARDGKDMTISSMCTVFAESEVISLIGRGEPRENIASAVVNSIAEKVASQSSRMSLSRKTIYLTGGLCECDYLLEALSKKLGKEVISGPDARFAGAIGAALSSMKLK